MAVKNKLKEILDERGIKYSWLTDEIGIIKSTMSNLLKNRYQTNIDIAFKIAIKLNLNIEDIFIYYEN